MRLRFCAVLLYRLLNAFLVTTYFYPDEWWQFQEPAHFAAFGEGYLTWDWRARIRSWIFPLPAIVLFKLARLFGNRFIEDFVVRHAGKFIMALNQALVDAFTAKLAQKHFGRPAQTPALLLSLASSYHFSRGLRTISNNFEMMACLVGLYYLPDFVCALPAFGIAAVARITSVSYFFCVCVAAFASNLKHRKRSLFLTLSITIACIAVGIIVDWFFYGAFTVSWLNFFTWNVSHKISHLYGKEPPLYHFKVTLPLMINVFLPFWLYGLYRSPSQLHSVIIPYLTVNCLQIHKEVRFLSPLLPLFLAQIAHGYCQLSIKFKSGLWKRCVSLAFLGALVFQMPIAYYYSRVKFSGRIAAIDHVRALIDANPNYKSVYFYADCHSFPGPSYLHRPGIKYIFSPCHPQAFDHLFSPVELESNTLGTLSTPPDVLVMLRKDPLVTEYLSEYSTSHRVDGIEIFHRK